MPYKGQFFNSMKSALAICQERQASSSQMLMYHVTSLCLKGKDEAWLHFGISKTLNIEKINR